MQQLYLDQTLGNPSSRHCMGNKSREVLEKSRRDIGQCLHVPPSHVIFTSGATESINMFLLGRARLISLEDRVRMITTDAEHPAVVNTFRHIDRTMRPQIEVVVLPTKYGLVQKQDIYDLLGRKDRRVDLVSVSYVNHELGSVLVDLAEIVGVCHRHGTLVHSDMTQAVGKLSIHLDEIGVDAISFSAHKFHGPMGVGCLIVRPEIQLQQLMFGGDQENKRRPGTQNVVGICGMALALQKSTHDYSITKQRFIQFHQMIMEGLRGVDFQLNASKHKISTTMSLSIANVDAPQLVEYLSQHHICISLGTACKAYSKEGSNVIKSLHLPPKYANGTIRISFGETTTEEHVKTLIDGIVEYVTLRR
jgi:cysteine desulfurase